MFPIFKVIFWVFIFILALSFFGISIQTIINSPAGQENFGYLLDLLSKIWDSVVAFVNHFISNFKQ